MLVFTQYVAMARLLERAPRAHAAIPTQFLHGGTPVRAREADGARFQDGARPGVPALAQGRRHRPQPDPRPTTSSTTTAGGTPPSRTRPPTAPTGSARPARCRCTGWSPRAPSRRRSPSCSPRKRALADSVLGAGEAALTELSDAELRDLVTLRPGEPAPRSPAERRHAPADGAAPRRRTRRVVVGEGLAAGGRGVGVRRARPARRPGPGPRRCGRRHHRLAGPAAGRGRRGRRRVDGDRRRAGAGRGVGGRVRRAGRGRVRPDRPAAGRRPAAGAGRARRGGRRRAAAVRRGAGRRVHLRRLDPAVPARAGGAAADRLAGRRRPADPGAAARPAPRGAAGRAARADDLEPSPSAEPADPDEEAAYDAAVRARRLLDLLESGDDEADLSHLL